MLHPSLFWHALNKTVVLTQLKYSQKEWLLRKLSRMEQQGIHELGDLDDPRFMEYLRVSIRIEADTILQERGMERLVLESTTAPLNMAAFTRE